MQERALTSVKYIPKVHRPRILFYSIDGGGNYPVKKVYARTSLGKCETYSSTAPSPRILVMIFYWIDEGGNYPVKKL